MKNERIIKVALPTEKQFEEYEKVGLTKLMVIDKLLESVRDEMMGVLGIEDKYQERKKKMEEFLASTINFNDASVPESPKSDIQRSSDD